MNKFTRHQKEYLADRGINEKAAAASGILSLTSAETKNKYGQSSPGLEVQYFNPNRTLLKNDRVPFSRVRLLPAKPLPAGKAKFLQKAGTKNHFYYDRAVKGWNDILRDPSMPITITEGEFKSVCANLHGLHCIGIGGVWSWKTKLNGASVPLSEFDDWEWKQRRVELAFDSDAISKPQVQAALSALAQELIRRGATVQILRLPELEGKENTGIDDYLVVEGREAYDALPREQVRLVLSPSAPLIIARTFVSTRYMVDDIRTLQYHQDTFHAWDGTCYPESENALIKSQLYEFLDSAHKQVQEKLVPFDPNRASVGNVLDAMKAETHLPRTNRPPCWLDGREIPPPEELISCRNGLLNLRECKLYPHDPQYFQLNALTFDYDPSAPKPDKWLGFLKELWPNDQSAIDALQEIFGYLLTIDTSLQKIFLLVGPKRSGKGTIARLLTWLLGRANVCAPTLASLGQNFGLAPLIPTQVAIVSDARLSKRTDQHVLTERLLTISGEDTVTIDRKYREAWTGKLKTRFMILTNELPKLFDASGALPSRFIILQLTKSFFGKEDPKLLEKLLPELPGILNWAIAGWKRLQRRGYFKMPKSALNTLQEMEDLASPVGAFVRDWCVVESGVEVACEDLFKSWQQFCVKRGQHFAGTAESFGRDLRAVLPNVQRKNLRRKGGRSRFYVGVRLNDEHVRVPSWQV